MTSLFVTHDQEEALELAHEVVVMNHGRIEQVGTSDDIYNRPSAPFVAAFVGSSNALRGVVHDGTVNLGQAVLDATTDAADGDVVVYVREHDVDLDAERADERSLPVTVERRTELGSSVKTHLRLEDGQPLVATLRNEHSDGIHPGAHLFATLRNPKVFADGVELQTRAANQQPRAHHAVATA